MLRIIFLLLSGLTLCGSAFAIVPLDDPDELPVRLSRISSSTAPDNVPAWNIRVEPNYLILHGEIATPILYSYDYYVKNPRYGSFKFSRGNTESATITPSVVYTTPIGTRFQYRPTLFVSLSGANNGGIEAWQAPEYNGAGAWLSTPYRDLEASIQAEFGGLAQYRHLIVNWSDTFPIDNQAEHIANIIEMMIEHKRDAWNIVLVGHSRGGILAHEISKLVTNATNAANIVTVLLDPTAAIVSGDKYPRNLTERDSSSFTAIGYNYFDQQGWLEFDGVSYFDGSTVGTESDMSISGYINTVVDAGGHQKFPSSWLSNSFSGSFNFSSLALLIKNAEPMGSYIADGESGAYLIRTDSRKFDIDGAVELSQDEFYSEFVVNVGAFSSGFSGAVGVDGASFTANMVFASAYSAVKADRVEFSATDTSTRVFGSFSRNGFDSSVGVLGVFDIDSNVNLTGYSVDIQLLGQNASVDGSLVYDAEAMNFIFTNSVLIPAQKALEAASDPIGKIKSLLGI